MSRTRGSGRAGERARPAPRRRLAAVAGLWLATAVPTAAHDFWLEPATYQPAAGQLVAVRARVGEGFRGDAVPRNSQWIERFFGHGADGEAELSGVEGMDPAGFWNAAAPGSHVVAYRGRRSTIGLEAAAFERYLLEEGLENVVALRAASGEADRPAREAFSRYAKTVLRVGAGGAGFGRALGLTLELIPESDPYALRPGDELPVRLLFRGRPAAGVLVAALSAEQPAGAQRQRTDAEGRTRVALDRPGPWLIKAVHMERAPADVDADWESWWASLTFAVPGG